MTEQREDEANDSGPQHRLTRRGFLIGSAVAAGAVATSGLGALVAAEKSLQQNGEDEIFNIEGQDVQVSYKEFLPEEEIADVQEAVLFLPGAPMRAKASVTWGSPKELAEEFKVRSYAIDARPKGSFHSNSIDDLEPEALRRFLVERGIKKVTIFAHSINTVTAINLAVLLEQHEPDIQINGLALANPMGFYPQDARDLLLHRYLEEIQSQPKLANPNAAQNYKDRNLGLWQIAGSLASEVATAGLGFPKLAAEQIRALTTISPNLAIVKAPIVLFLANEDKLSEVKNLLPEEEIKKRKADPMPDEELRDYVWNSGKWEGLPEDAKQRVGSKEEFMDHYINAYRTREEMAATTEASEQYVRENILPNASGVKVIRAKKFASHLAFGERSQITSHIISRIFERIRR